MDWIVYILIAGTTEKQISSMYYTKSECIDEEKELARNLEGYNGVECQFVPSEYGSLYDVPVYYYTPDEDDNDDTDDTDDESTPWF